MEAIVQEVVGMLDRGMDRNDVIEDFLSRRVGKIAAGLTNDFVDRAEERIAARPAAPVMCVCGKPVGHEQCFCLYWQ